MSSAGARAFQNARLQKKLKKQADAAISAAASAYGQGKYAETDALCRHIEAHCPVKPVHWFIEANFSGDKKSTYLGLITGRGQKSGFDIAPATDRFRRLR